MKDKEQVYDGSFSTDKDRVKRPEEGAVKGVNATIKTLAGGARDAVTVTAS